MSDEDAGGHERGLETWMCERKLLTDQRQHGGIGEVERRRDQGQNEQGPVLREREPRILAVLLALWPRAKPRARS